MDTNHFFNSSVSIETKRKFRKIISNNIIEKSDQSYVFKASSLGVKPKGGRAQI